MRLLILAAGIIAALALAAYIKAASTPGLPNVSPADDDCGGFGLGPGYRTLFERSVTP
jgi:hypothetical protein